MSNLIKYTEVSKILSGSRFTIQVNRVPKKHVESIKELEDFCDEWELMHTKKKRSKEGGNMELLKNTPNRFVSRRRYEQLEKDNEELKKDNQDLIELFSKLPKYEDMPLPVKNEQNYKKVLGFWFFLVGKKLNTKEE